MSFHLEIACFNADSARMAQMSGADRIEFCKSYELGGITPDFDTLKSLKPELRIPVFVMIRPRGGDFTYSETEFEQMKADVETFRSIADGFVFGILTNDLKLDISRNAALVAMTTLPCTLHRAFDEILNPHEALEDAITCGFQNILTSGGKGNAIQNIAFLSELTLKASGRITIMPGGGIRAENLKELKTSGAVWYHSAALEAGKESVQASQIEQMIVILQH